MLAFQTGERSRSNAQDSGFSIGVRFVQAFAEHLRLVEGVRMLMADTKRRLREGHPKLYSHDLLNNLFRHPYTRIEFVQQELNVSRPTATKYLDELAESGLLLKHRAGRNNYYINQPLIGLFVEREAPK